MLYQLVTRLEGIPTGETSDPSTLSICTGILECIYEELTKTLYYPQWTNQDHTGISYKVEEVSEYGAVVHQYTVGVESI